MSFTVADLIDQTRTQLDESDTTNISDTHIIQALNRAQRKAANITARKYDSLFWETTQITTVAGQREYDIPSKAYGKRVEKVEIIDSQVAWEVRRIDNHKRTPYINTSQTQRPYYYTLTKNKIELYPTPGSGVTVEIHYNEQPRTLVKPQGRITNVGVTSVIVDSLGADISTSVTGFSSYINFVDYTTGDSKGYAQIASINTTTREITIKTSGLTRSTVLGNTVGTSLPADLAADDYICLITGTCVPELPEAYSDYLIQYAVVELRRRLGETIQEELVQLKDLETELEKMWVGRETATRIRKSSAHWDNNLGNNLRRLFRQ